MQEKKEKLRSLISWALYDWGNSAFSTIIKTFVFPAYFIRYLAADEISGTTQWGLTFSIAGLLIGFGGPLLGAIADNTGNRKSWIGLFTMISVIFTGLLILIKPEQDFFYWGLIFAAVGTIGSQYAFIFYNSLLVDLADESEIGRWSGWGWALGYAGGLASLLCSYPIFLMLSDEELLNVRSLFLLAAAWYALFSLPLFFFVKEPMQKGFISRNIIQDSLKQLKTTFSRIRQYKNVFQFLVAHLFYIDALLTIFVFGGLFAASAYDLSETEILFLGVVLNIAAGIGAAVFGMIDDWIGSKSTLLVSILCITCLTAGILLNDHQQVFWYLVLGVGIFVGPIQASSRSMMVKIIPKELKNEMFGFFAFSGKATAFLGPLFVSIINTLTQSQRWGMSIIILFFLIGGGLLTGVKETEA